MKEVIKMTATTFEGTSDYKVGRRFSFRKVLILAVLVMISWTSTRLFVLPVVGVNGSQIAGVSFPQVFAISTMTAMDPGMFGQMPGFPQEPCDFSKFFTGKDCRYEVEHGYTDDGHEMIEVRIMNGDGKLSYIQAIKFSFNELKDLGFTQFAGKTEGWLTYIKVTDGLGSYRLGATTIKAGEVVMKSLGGGSAVHIFVDHAGWGPSIMAKLPFGTPLVQVSEKVWLYLMP